MNYRHAYHAGNPGDVLKHVLLVAAIEALLDKPSPFFILDTHAGIGTYDLASVEAQKTGEWREGIGKLLQADAPLAERYLSLVRALNPDGDIGSYPGSPAIVASLLRPQDRLVLAELHPEDNAVLRRWARGMSNVAVHLRDGYEAIAAFVPPKEKRGLILVDPPYEVTDEFERLAAAIIAGWRKWPEGRWMIWHPLKERAPVWRLEEKLVEAGVPDMISVELLVRPMNGVQFAGSGVILINPPYKLTETLAPLLAELQAALAPDTGGHTVRRLAG